MLSCLASSVAYLPHATCAAQPLQFLHHGGEGTAKIEGKTKRLAEIVLLKLVGSHMVQHILKIYDKSNKLLCLSIRSLSCLISELLTPLLMCLVYWAVFSSLMDMRGSGIDNFAVFLMCGQLLFNFFNEATSTSMSSVLSAAPLLKKVYIPKYIFPLEKCCFAMVNCVFSFVALLLVMIFTGAPFHLTLIEAVYPLVTLFFFSLGVGLFLAAATVFFRDIMHIWSVFMNSYFEFLKCIFFELVISIKEKRVTCSFCGRFQSHQRPCGTRLVIEIKTGFDPNAVLAQLFKHTPLHSLMLMTSSKKMHFRNSK